MSDDVLKLFEGLTPKQAKTLRLMILQALPNLRREVLDNSAPARRKISKTGAKTK